MLLLDVILSGLGVLGLGGIGLWLVNRLHGLHLPRRLLKFIAKAILVLLAAALLSVCWQAAKFGILPCSWTQVGGMAAVSGLLVVGMVLAWVAGLGLIASWFIERMQRPAAALLEDRQETLDVPQRLGFVPAVGALARCLTWLPGNEVFHPRLHFKTLAMPRLPEPLEGLTIAHLSDLHFHGGVSRDFFRCTFDVVAQWRPDMIMLTGDIIDHERCLAWIDELFPRLTAPYGAHFVLGNHDLRIRDEQALRRRLGGAGWNDASRRVAIIRGPRDSMLAIAGNEAPWFGAPPCEAQLREMPRDALRILASHSPDQLSWAQRHDFDLMLAGHTHGGQVRLPGIGPLFVPSRYGRRYSAGVFQCGATVLHVSRGLSGLDPLRWNCPPELTLLRLTRHNQDQSNRNAPKFWERQTEDAGVVHA